MNFFKALFSNKTEQEDASISRYHEEMQRLKAVNAEKRAKAIASLGEKWLLHPNNVIKKSNLA